TGHKPIGHANIFGSIPDKWVTVYTEDIGNTFGPKGFSRGSSLQVSWSKYPRSHVPKRGEADRICNSAVGTLERFDQLHLVIGKLKTKDIDVFRYTVGARRPRYRHHRIL